MHSMGSILLDGVWMGPYIASTQNAANHAIWSTFCEVDPPTQKAGSAPGLGQCLFLTCGSNYFQHNQ